MSIPTISNTTTTATDNRSTARQAGANTDNGTGNGVGNGNVGSQGATGSGQSDAVSISSRAADLQSLEASIRQLPDTDSSRVNALREQINAGDYVVDSQRVADRILALESKL